MGKKKIINQNLSKAIKIHNLFKSSNCPDINTIEQLLKDENGNSDRVIDIIMFFNDHTDDNNTIVKTPSTPENKTWSDKMSSTSISLHSDFPSQTNYSDQLDVFKEMVRDCFSEEQIMDIWTIALENNLPSNSTFTSISTLSNVNSMKDDQIILKAIEIAFDNMSVEAIAIQDYIEFVLSGTVVDERSVQEVARSLVLERFSAENNETLRAIIDRVLVDCNYDIEETSRIVCDQLFCGYLDNDEDFPSLQDATEVNKMIESAPLNLTSHFKPYQHAVESNKSSFSALSSLSSLSSYSKPSSPMKLSSSESVAKPSSSLSSSSSSSSSPSPCLWKSLLVTNSTKEDNKKSRGSLLQKHANWREVASRERILMVSKFSDAAINYRRKNSLSSYMSDCGRNHQRNMKEAHLKAALCALEAFNPNYSFELDVSRGIIKFLGPSSYSMTIDLHLLTVNEGIQVINSIAIWLKENRTSVSHVNFIVGLGKHSVNHQPTLGPSLVKYLSSVGYKHSNRNGMIRVIFSQ